MNSVLYQFENINLEKQREYIFQFVQNRRLTDIYHHHDFYELLLILNGHCTHFINGKNFYNQEGCFVLLRPLDTHCFTEQSDNIAVLSLSVKKEEFELFANIFDRKLLKSIAKSVPPICFTSCFPLLKETLHYEVFHNITEYDCKLLLSYFLKLYIEKTNFKHNDSNLPQNLSIAVEEIKKTENLKKGIPEFIRISHYSQSHLTRLVKKHFNMGLKQYINELRLQNSYDEIILTNKPIEEISENVGFLSYSHFNKIFKARFLITPSKLRKTKGLWTA